MKRAFLLFEICTLIAFALMGVVDLVFFMWGGSEETLSYQFWVFARQWPVIPFGLGFLCGHLVWQYNPDTIKPA